MVINAISRQLWSSYSGCLFHGDYLPTYAETNSNLLIVLGRFAEIANTYYSGLTVFVGKPTLEYLRLKFRRGNPHIALALVDGKVAHISFVASTASYSEVSLLAKSSNAIGPCITAEKFRGQGIYPAVLRYLRSSHLGRNGLDIFCRVENFSSQKGILKAGFVFKMKYHHVTRLGISFVRPENPVS